jgi:ribosomal protein S18 acetylase RimI-like enzyme
MTQSTGRSTFVVRPAIEADAGAIATLDHAARQGADTLWLCVWDRNPRAIAFYRKWKFEEAGSKVLTIDDVEFIDLILKRKVNQKG